MAFQQDQTVEEKAASDAKKLAAAQKQSTYNAAPQMAAYDQYAQTAMGKSPAEAMQQAQAAAAQQAQSVSDQAVQQAIKAGRTGGMMGGQAALAAQQQAASAYGQQQQAGQQQYFDTTQLGASLGQGMSERIAGKEGLQNQMAMAKMADATARRGQNMQMIGAGVGALGGVAGVAMSDRNLKDNIKEQKSSGLDKIKMYSYKYKGSEKPEAGIIAQELEKTELAPAVIETPIGKAIDTNRLTTMNTGELSLHEKRIKEIERLIKGLSGIKKPEGKK